MPSETMLCFSEVFVNRSKYEMRRYGMGNRSASPYKISGTSVNVSENRPLGGLETAGVGIALFCMGEDVVMTRWSGRVGTGGRCRGLTFKHRQEPGKQAKVSRLEIVHRTKTRGIGAVRASDEHVTTARPRGQRDRAGHRVRYPLSLVVLHICLGLRGEVVPIRLRAVLAI